MHRLNFSLLNSSEIHQIMAPENRKEKRVEYGKEKGEKGAHSGRRYIVGSGIRPMQRGLPVYHRYREYKGMIRPEDRAGSFAAAPRPPSPQSQPFASMKKREWRLEREAQKGEEPHHLQAHVDHDDDKDIFQLFGRKPVRHPNPHLGHHDAGNGKKHPLKQIDVPK